MYETLRWGIISTGNIANTFARGIQHLPHATIQAVGSRSQASADAFGEIYDIPKRYDSYEAVVNDPDVDVVYIGTPHVFHHDNMMLALNAGKHVLCEKPFTINAEEAQACIQLAREKGLFLMEAVWMRYIPAIVQVRQWLKQGLLGEIRAVRADISMDLPFDPDNRLYNLDLGGGALLDLGIYVINFATMVLGLPPSVTSRLYMGETDVDYYDNLVFQYPQADAFLTASANNDGPCNAVIVGSKGYITLHREFWAPTRLTLKLEGQDAQVHDIPYESSGLNYEADEVHTCLRKGKLESDVLPLSETLAIMRLMDQMRYRQQFYYPSEQ